MNWNVYKFVMQLPYLVRLFFSIISIIILSGTMISFLEPENFPEVFDGIWWATMTAATVGYGDYVPATFLGRILGIILVLVGAGFVAAFFTSFAKKVIQEQNTITKGTVMVKEKNHLVIIGWNERTKKLMLKLEKHENTVVVLIDDSLEKNPFPDKSQIFFIKGSSVSDSVLKQANITEAKFVLITADQSKKESDADMYTILNIVAIKGIAPNTYTIAEILTEEHEINARRAGADEIIPTNTLSSERMLTALLGTDPIQNSPD